MRRFATHKDIERALATLRSFVRATGTVPPELVKSYRAALASARRMGLVAHFYEVLTKEMPNLLPIFADPATAAEEKEVNEDAREHRQARQ